MTPDYTIVCERCGTALPTTPHLAAHLRDDHGMVTSEAIREAKGTRERKGVESHDKIKAERDALRASLEELIKTLDYARSNVHPHREIHRFLFGSDARHPEHAAITKARAALLLTERRDADGGAE